MKPVSDAFHALNEPYHKKDMGVAFYIVSVYSLFPQKILDFLHNLISLPWHLLLPLMVSLYTHLSQNILYLLNNLISLPDYLLLSLMVSYLKIPLLYPALFAALLA